jgi:hypothetical protein
MNKINNKKLFKLPNVLLSLTFIVTLINLSYYISKEEYHSVLTFVIMISVSSMFTKNLFIMLLSGIVGMNLFYLIKKDTIENMANSNDSLDMSYNSFKTYVNNIVKNIDINSLENADRDFVLYIKSNYKLNEKEYYTEFKNKYRQMSNTKWIDKNIINFREITIMDDMITDKDEPFTVNEEETNSKNIDTKEEIENVVEKLKESNPELSETLSETLSQSLDVLNKIDINEMNKLINKMNTMLDSSE